VDVYSSLVRYEIQEIIWDKISVFHIFLALTVTITTNDLSNNFICFRLILMCLNIPNRFMWHFDLKKFRPSEVNRVKISLACVSAFIAIGWPLIIYKTGIMGWIKFWLMPWLGYHFWVMLVPVPFVLVFGHSNHVKLITSFNSFFVYIQGFIILADGP
jgi:hypothetical protein